MNGLHPKGRNGVVTTDVPGNGEPCSYCKREMIAWTDLHPTKDHVIPASRGGTETVMCCYQCNQMKADAMPDEWTAFMRENAMWWLRGKVFRSPKPSTWIGVCPVMLACSNALYYEKYKHLGVFR